MLQCRFIAPIWNIFVDEKVYDNEWDLDVSVDSHSDGKDRENRYRGHGICGLFLLTAVQVVIRQHIGVPLTWILLPGQPLWGINAWSPWYLYESVGIIYIPSCLVA